MNYDKEQQNIIGLYVVFLVAVFMNFVPVGAVALLGVCLLLVVLVAAYIYRARAALGSLTYNHATFVIVTFWVSSFLLLIGMIIGTIWVYKMGDHTILTALVHNINAGAILSPKDMQNSLEQYMFTNMKLLVTASLSTLGPSILYVLYRVIKGLSFAHKNKNLPAPAAWF